MKYQFGSCTSCQIGGIVRKKSDKIVFDTDKPAWKSLKEEIHAAFEAGYLEMTKDSAKKFKAENEKAFKEAKEKADKIAANHAEILKKKAETMEKAKEKAKAKAEAEAEKKLLELKELAEKEKQRLEAEIKAEAEANKKK